MKTWFELYNLPKSSEVFSMPSPKMIKTLKDCLEFETLFPGKPYGPRDIGASFSGLYKRGLLDININTETKSKPGSWFVTATGLHFLLDVSAQKAAPEVNILFNNMYKLRQNVMLLHNSMFNLKLTAAQIAMK